MKRLPFLPFVLLTCSLFLSSFAAHAANDDSLDLKLWALECYGLRGAVAMDATTVVAVFGASATGARNNAKAWRILSEEDPAYAYDHFVQPVEAKGLPADVEFPWPEGFQAETPAKNELKRHLVQLKLPTPLKPGVEYGLVALGDGAPVTGAKTGCFFRWDGTDRPSDPATVRVPADGRAAWMVGLRRASPLGDGKVALEFGASFSLAAWRDPDQYDVRVNGEKVAVAEFGRRSKIDVYLPVGWPFKVLMQHDVFIDLGRDLKPGDRVAVSVGTKICSGVREAGFAFDHASTLTPSIQANQIGYLPDGPKVAYLGFWLGSFPEQAKSAGNRFSYATPPTPAEAYQAPPQETPADTPADAPSDPSTVQPSERYDDLAPYALRFRAPPAFELVREKDGKVAFRGVAQLTHNGLHNDGRSNHSAENVYTLDFSAFAEPGRYHLRVPGVGRSLSFDIAADVYTRAFRLQAAGLFAQRCGFELTPDHAPGWRRIACHTNGVTLTTVETWTKNGFGPLRESTVPAPNPAYPALKAAQDALDADPALAARFPLAGDLRNAVAGSAAALASVGDSWTWVDDPSFGAKVLRTGRKENGLAGTSFAVDPAKGATVTFWLRRHDADGNKLGGELFRLGPAKGAHLSIDALWGVVRFANNSWQRLGDDQWRLLAVRLGPVGEKGKVHAELLSDGKVVTAKDIDFPASDELLFAHATDDGSAGCHFRDLRLYSRPLADAELATLANRAAPTIPKVIPLRGGHHDAGDYNPRCHIDVAQTLLAAWERAPRKFADGQLDIPEAGNGLPDIVDEALWALEPWLSLQDDDGGVRDGTESAGDPNFYQTVELDDKGDFAYAKSCRASFEFAATFAQASRVLAACDRKAQAADFLARARRAYDWGVANVPEGLKDLAQFTEYRYASRAYAAAELLHATGEDAFLRDFRECAPWGNDPKANVSVSGRYEALPAALAFVRDPKNETRDPALFAGVRAAVIREADFYIKGSDQMAYKFIRHPDAPISWGTAAYGNFLRPVIAAWYLTGEKKYRDWTIRTCDNTLGANPLGLSWIVGLGERTIRAPLHNSRYRPEGVPVDGMQGEGPWSRGNCYNYKETVYPKHDPAFAPLHAFVDCHFAIGMDEGIVPHMALDTAVFGLLQP